MGRAASATLAALVSFVALGACADEFVPGVNVGDAGADVGDAASAPDVAVDDDAAVPDVDGGDVDVPPPPPPPIENGMVVLSGTTSPVHDPAIIESRGAYYLFSTGQGIKTFVSSNLGAWTATGSVFSTKPSWITTTDPSEPDTLWAPDISFFGGVFHLYYSASSFGSRNSCIGHATTPSLANPVWTDHGSVICSTTSDDWNAIDPNAVIDADGTGWLAFGSFWSGLKLIRLDSAGSRDGSAMYALATRSNQAVEAPFIVRRNSYYYLFESVDACCRGVNSTYKIMVGRATDVRGPYVDQAGTPLLSGGGTLLVEGNDSWKGPGHNAVLLTRRGDYFNVYHSYDVNRAGTPTLRIAELRWSADDWPSSAGP